MKQIHPFFLSVLISTNLLKTKHLYCCTVYLLRDNCFIIIFFTKCLYCLGDSYSVYASNEAKTEFIYFITRKQPSSADAVLFNKLLYVRGLCLNSSRVYGKQKLILLHKVIEFYISIEIINCSINCNKKKLTRGLSKTQF